MTNPDDILGSMPSLAENSENLMGGSGSKATRNVGRVSDIKNDGDGSAAAVGVSARVVETETVVESTDNIEDGFSSPSNGDTSVSVDRIGDDGSSDGGFGRDEKIEDNDSSCPDNGENLNAIGTKGQGNGEKLEDMDHGFCVGDIVWSKIKSHPWWPGQIYDSRDASKLAVKYSQEGRLLVANFGDGSCSWCLPSQLIPFVENFKEISMDGSSRSFHKAIQGALHEVGRLVESNMQCKCVPLEKRDDLARPVVENAGLKAGVLAPEVDIHRLSVPKYEPAEILSKVMHHAKGVSIDSALELAVLKSSLSAFYRAQDGNGLPKYLEPVCVEGLEDKNKDGTAVANGFSLPIEGPIVGPEDDEWLISSRVASETPWALEGEKVYHRKKKRSVAELMGANTGVKLKNKQRATVKESKDVGKSSSSLKRKKRNHREVEEGGSEEAGRTPKVVVSNAAKSGDRNVDEKRIKIEGAAVDTSGKAEMVSTPRERRKSKYLSPPYTDPRWMIGSASTKLALKLHTTEAYEDRHGSPPLSKIVDEASDDKLPIRELKRRERTSVDTSPPTLENDKKMTFSESDVKVPVNELLSEIQFAAVNPLCLGNEGSLDTVHAFVSALRSSTYLHGADYKIFQKCKNKKRKSTLSRLQDQENESKSAHKKKKSPKAEKTKEKPDASKSRKASKVPLPEEKLEGKALSRLILTFAPEYPLPSKEEVIKLFGKFGSLNEKETSVMTDSHTIQIAYMKDTDAEAAFKSSINESPFGIESVNYWLQYGLKPHGAFLHPIKSGPEKTESSDDCMTDVRVIRQKIEIMTAIVENYHSKFSTVDKATLKDEMKHLMDSVETASEKVHVIAEKHHSHLEEI